jgi:predicted ABC-type ATPase
LLASRQSFAVETTLSGNTYLKMAARAKEAGFTVMAILVGTTSVEINIERIKGRVEKGGHDVPEDDQRRRFPRTLVNMKKLLAVVDLAVILDNSEASGYVLVGGWPSGTYHLEHDCPLLGC